MTKRTDNKRRKSSVREAKKKKEEREPERCVDKDKDGRERTKGQKNQEPDHIPRPIWSIALQLSSRHLPIVCGQIPSLIGCKRGTGCMEPRTNRKMLKNGRLHGEDKENGV